MQNFLCSLRTLLEAINLKLEYHYSHIVQTIPQQESESDMTWHDMTWQKVHNHMSILVFRSLRSSVSARQIMSTLLKLILVRMPLLRMYIRTYVWYAVVFLAITIASHIISQLLRKCYGYFPWKTLARLGIIFMGGSQRSSPTKVFWVHQTFQQLTISLSSCCSLTISLSSCCFNEVIVLTKCTLRQLTER